jgi:CubicO group peptidase (beta-lactamase class C family)
MPFFQAKGIVPAAGYSSTVIDLARFASWQFRLIGGGKEEVLRANTLKEMQRFQWMDPNTTWGLGFTVWRSSGKSYVGHGGICAGYRSQLTLQPQEKIAAVFLANSSGVNSWI